MVFIDVIAIIVGIIGIIGCFLPVIPGPPLSWAALLLLYFNKGSEMSLTFLLFWLVIAIVVTILDYLVPSYFTKKTGGSRAAARGTLVGLILGILFFPPWGMIIGAFLGALLAEMFINGSEMKKSLKPALGSFLGFLFGTGLKLVSSCIMMYYTIRYL